MHLWHRTTSENAFRLLGIITICFTLICIHFTETSWQTILGKLNYANYQTVPNMRHQCIMPMPDPFDRRIVKLISHRRDTNCSQIQPYLSYIDVDNNLVLNDTEFAQLNLLQSEDYLCTYAPFERGPNDNDNEYTTWPYERIYLCDAISIPTDQVFVNCTYGNGTHLYANIHALVSKKKVRKRHRDSELSVFLLVIDSLSGPMFDRFLPKTEKYLRSTMNYHRFRGNTRVGDNSLPNFAPLLTGKRYSSETPDMPKELPDIPDLTFDRWPFIWKKFAAKGYVTAYVEDEPHYDLFHYALKGFNSNPTDHYNRACQVAMRNSQLAKFSEFQNQRGDPLCFGNHPKPFLLFDLMERHLVAYKDHPYFLIGINNQPSHENQMDVEMLDEYLMNFLRRQFESHRFDNTVVMILGDHGPRVGDIRSTLVGRLEENLPLHSIWFPSWFYRRYPHILPNLKLNEMTLTTVFDTHQTLMDVFHENFECDDDYDLRSVSQICQLPISRGCSEAGVPYYYCACDTTTNGNLSDKSVANVTQTAVNTISAMLENVTDVCAPVELKTILNHQAVRMGQYFFMGTIVISTYPCNAKFEISFEIDGDTFEPKITTMALGQLKRTNKYGDQSHCVEQKELKPFCCCFDPPNSTVTV